ncbi:hypothetical protein VPNG_01768 [Cytospora leucostoma]|uniref:Uncharacterized protein n=1 Tax=Cytospora leucostoma TaxID=1230097 RepID=A0A423XIH3_9PEZI|nr:hypothetical protein VPNG_01768 [Cytospora leucostoma]
MCHKVVTHFTKCAHRVDSHTICNRIRRQSKRGLAQAKPCRTGAAVQTVKSDALCGGCEAFFTGLQQRHSPKQHGKPHSIGWKAAPTASAYDGALLRGGGDGGAGGLEHAFRRTLRIKDDEPARERLEKGRGFSHVPKGLPASGAAAATTTRGRYEGGGGGGGERKRSFPEPAMLVSSMSTGRRASRGNSKKRVRFSPEVDVRFFEQYERVRSAAAIEGVA